MFSPFKTTPLNDGYSIVEPPAGLITAAYEKLKVYSTDGRVGSDQIAAIFILACVHKDGKPLTAIIAEEVPECQTLDESGSIELVEAVKTIRFTFTTLPEDSFKAIIDELLFSIPRDTLEEWFDTIDKSCYITRKTTEPLKNDSPPAVTTGS
jgi:hypothetical protein